MSIKILQISSEVNVGSVGKIAEQIGIRVIENNWESHIAYGREISDSKSTVFRIGNNFDILKHVLYTRLTDNHGFSSSNVTEKLISKIRILNPDIIHLQHIHGYFINVDILFKFLGQHNIPVVWTFHDCWAFTGHCAYYDTVGCEKWKTQCEKCPQTNSYPKSLWFDNSKTNFIKKKSIFSLCKNLTIVPVSKWLEDQVKQSFLKNISTKVILNGVDLSIFKYSKNVLREKYNLLDKYIILGVAHIWDPRKGLQDFIELQKHLDNSFQIILIGLSKKQIKKLPSKILGFQKTSTQFELAEFYSVADVFVNPTKDEALGLTNMEAIACGTPVITYRSGGSPESVHEGVGFVLEKGDVKGIFQKINILKIQDEETIRHRCEVIAKKYFDAVLNFNSYIDLYRSLLNANP